MLQQTQVATVIPFYERFIQAFPTLGALAAASEQAVLRAWEGLGYYGRARNLLGAARRLVAEHDGQIPDDPAALLALPGIGRYILGAVLSQAHDRRLPILEANSQRVLCRLLAVRDDPRLGPVQRWLWQAAEVLLPARRPGDFNQALMELGALVCTPAAPNCPSCPLAGRCAASRQGLQDCIPLGAPPLPQVQVAEAAVVVRRGRKVFVVQRPAQGRWASLWEFPHGSLWPEEAPARAATRLLRELAGLRARIRGELLTLRHTITRYRITLVCFEADFCGGSFRSDFYPRGRWLNRDQLHTYPFSVPQRRLAEALVKSQGQTPLF